MNEPNHDDIRAAVREQYGSVARATTPSCCTPSCCSPDVGASLKLGYSAEEALQQYEALGAFGFRGAYARLVHVEALEATGDHASAATALATARDRLLLQAAKIGDLALRRRFLEDLPENARTLALARQWNE